MAPKANWMLLSKMRFICFKRRKYVQSFMSLLVHLINVEPSLGTSGTNRIYSGRQQEFGSEWVCFVFILVKSIIIITSLTERTCT
jgi:hypothetical protein